MLVDGQEMSAFESTQSRLKRGQVAIRLLAGGHIEIRRIEIKEPTEKDVAVSGGHTVSTNNAKDALQPGSIWNGSWTFQDPGFQGMQAQYAVTIGERNGNRFTAEGVFTMEGNEIRTQLRGVITEGSKIEYSEVGRDAFRFRMTGEIKGNRIGFKFTGTGTAGQDRFGVGEIATSDGSRSVPF